MYLAWQVLTFSILCVTFRPETAPTELLGQNEGENTSADLQEKADTRRRRADTVNQSVDEGPDNPYFVLDSMMAEFYDALREMVRGRGRDLKIG